jgi:Na+/H+ antiporter NhaD/arsenite permease-like protein
MACVCVRAARCVHRLYRSSCAILVLDGFARRQGTAVSFWQHARIGVPVGFVILAVGTALLYLLVWP